MKQITEDFVSFETAQLLKEKGFEQICDKMYKLDGKICNNPKSTHDWYVKMWYPCATLQIAMAWLREEKGIYLDVFIDDDSEMPWTYNIHKELRDGTTECIYHHHGNYYPLRTGYEEAVEAALNYALKNLI